jgi:hypothetical protein
MKVYLRSFEYEDLKLIQSMHTNEGINMLTGGNKFFNPKNASENGLRIKCLMTKIKSIVQFVKMKIKK